MCGFVFHLLGFCFCKILDVHQFNFAEYKAPFSSEVYVWQLRKCVKITLIEAHVYKATVGEII